MASLLLLLASSIISSVTSKLSSPIRHHSSSHATRHRTPTLYYQPETQLSLRYDDTNGGACIPHIQKGVVVLFSHHRHGIVIILEFEQTRGQLVQYTDQIFAGAGYAQLQNINSQ